MIINQPEKPNQIDNRVKLILPIEVAADIEPHLPPNAQFVRVDDHGNLDSDASDAEVYFNWFNLKSAALHKVLAATPALLWQHTRALA